MEPSLFSWITQHWDDLVLIVTGLITVASIVVKLTPSQVDDQWLAAFRRLFERVALNAPRTRTPGSPPPVPPASVFRDWSTSQAPPPPPTKPGGSPPATLGALLFALLLGSTLGACAPVAGPTPLLSPEDGAQIAAACREAAATIRGAADRRGEGALPDDVVSLVDRLVAVSDRPCRAQAQALPSDLDRIETATQNVQEALANG